MCLLHQRLHLSAAQGGIPILIIPEIETVVILVPRTGSGSLYRAAMLRYPMAMLIYRHMEADGIPQGYDRWAKVGIVRSPLDRLWSVYKFLQSFGLGPNSRHVAEYSAAMRQSVKRPFSDWLMHNETVFTSPYDSANLGRYWPLYTVRHPLPENRKSQFLYLRSDLGTDIYRYGSEEKFLYQRLDIDPGRENVSRAASIPIISREAKRYMEGAFSWDYEAVK